MLSVLPALKVDGSYSPTFRRVIAYFVRLIEARRALKMQRSYRTRTTRSFIFDSFKIQCNSWES